MKFDTYVPSERLAPYVSRLVITENAFENEYTVFPSTGLVIGFQYRGTLSLLQEKKETLLHPAGITGISDRMLEKLGFVESKVFELVAQQKST